MNHPLNSLLLYGLLAMWSVTQASSLPEGVSFPEASPITGGPSTSTPLGDSEDQSVPQMKFSPQSPIIKATPTIEELDHIVAVVNNDVITNLELQSRMRLILQQLRGQNTQLPAPEVLRKQVLDRLVLEHIQLQQAERTGIRVGDENINRVISNIAQENNLTLDQFREVLKNEGFAFAEFRDNIRKEIILNQLRRRKVESKINVTEQEVDAYLASSSNRQTMDTDYHLAHILIALPEAATPEKIQAAKAKAEQVVTDLRNGADFAEVAVAVSDGRTALQGGDLGWLKAGQIPTIATDIIGNLGIGDVSDPIRAPGGFHIVKLLNKRDPQVKHVVKQTMVRHILIKPDQVTTDTQARMHLLRLRDRILNGDDFAVLAKGHSDDKGTAADGGSLGWVNPGNLVPQFEDTMNKLKPGEISQPVRSPFGWHIIQVMSRRVHDDTNEYQRNEARSLIRKRKIMEANADWLRRIRAEAYVEYRLNE